jgi:hypothetical protein
MLPFRDWGHRYGRKISEDIQAYLEFGSDKFLPFEGAGAVDSKWSLTINGYNITGEGNKKVGSNLNLDDIEDVIVYISYTARMGKTRS